MEGGRDGGREGSPAPPEQQFLKNESVLARPSKALLSCTSERAPASGFRGSTAASFHGGRTARQRRAPRAPDSLCEGGTLPRSPGSTRPVLSSVGRWERPRRGRGVQGRTQPAHGVRPGISAPSGQARQHPGKSWCSERSGCCREGALQTLPSVKWSPGSPPAPAPWRGGEEAGRVLLPVQTTAWLFAVFIRLSYKSQQETVCAGGRQLERGGSPAPASTVPAPHSPGTLRFTARGCTQTTKNGSSESGARVNRCLETCLRGCSYNRPSHPRRSAISAR